MMDFRGVAPTTTMLVPAIVVPCVSYYQWSFT
jgi:hypothetical protein